MNYNTKMNFTFESLKTSRKSVINLRKLYLEHLNSKNHEIHRIKGFFDKTIKLIIIEFYYYFLNGV